MSLRAQTQSYDTWVEELQSTIGKENGVHEVSTDNVLVHLVEVLLDIVQRWIEHVGINRQNPQVMTTYRSSQNDMEHVFTMIEEKLAPLPSHPRVTRCLDRTTNLTDNFKKLNLVH
jgi:hypothetical protein